MGGLGVPQPVSYSYSQGIVAMMLVFQMIYVATIGPLYYTLVAEIPATRLRDKTVRLAATFMIVTMYVDSSAAIVHPRQLIGREASSCLLPYHICLTMIMRTCKVKSDSYMDLYASWRLLGGTFVFRS